MKMMVEEKGEDKDYEIDCLARSIKEVELAKKDRPDQYAAALSKLKGEAKAIMSIDDLKAKYKKLTEPSEDEEKPKKEAAPEEEEE